VGGGKKTIRGGGGREAEERRGVRSRGARSLQGAASWLIVWFSVPHPSYSTPVKAVVFKTKQKEKEKKKR
jgi:hypothetical protein